MTSVLAIDWRTLFAPGAVAEIIVRGSVVYLVLFTLLRVVLRREAGTIGIADLLLIVLIADAAQNAMANEYRSITDGIILVGTIVFWNYALDWLGYRFPRIHRFIRPPPLPLVKHGRVLWRNMRRELITEEELMSQLRMQGIDDIADVKEAYMEGDGRISIVPYNHGRTNGRPERPRRQ